MLVEIKIKLNMIPIQLRCLFFWSQLWHFQGKHCIKFCFSVWCR